MLPELFLMFRRVSLPCRLADLLHALVNPAAAISALFVKLPYDPIQRPLQEPQTVAFDRGGPREQIGGKALHPGSENLVEVTVKRGVPPNDG
jgi:hypothetical protein